MNRRDAVLPGYGDGAVGPDEVFKDPVAPVVAAGKPDHHQGAVAGRVGFRVGKAPPDTIAGKDLIPVPGGDLIRIPALTGIREHHLVLRERNTPVGMIRHHHIRYEGVVGRGDDIGRLTLLSYRPDDADAAARFNGDVDAGVLRLKRRLHCVKGTGQASGAEDHYPGIPGIPLTGLVRLHTRISG